MNAQHEFCRLRAPSNGWANTPYDLGEAQTCLDYVERALEDASLTPEEWDTIRLMEGACGSLFPGLGEDGGGNSGSSPVVIRNGGQTCDGPSDVCSTGYYCREDVKICAELPGEGNVCVDGVPSCREDLRCVDLDGTSVCQARYQKGDDCLVNDDCLSGLCSDTGGDGVCVDDIDISVNAPVCEYFR